MAFTLLYIISKNNLPTIDTNIDKHNPEHCRKSTPPNNTHPPSIYKKREPLYRTTTATTSKKKRIQHIKMYHSNYRYRITLCKIFIS
jgi:hypothetical protein